MMKKGRARLHCTETKTQHWILWQNI